MDFRESSSILLRARRSRVRPQQPQIDKRLENKLKSSFKVRLKFYKRLRTHPEILGPPGDKVLAPEVRRGLKALHHHRRRSCRRYGASIIVLAGRREGPQQGSHVPVLCSALCSLPWSCYLLTGLRLGRQRCAVSRACVRLVGPCDGTHMVAQPASWPKVSSKL